MTEETKAPKAKTVIDDMAARFVAENLDSGVAYLQRVSGEYADFASYPLAAVGMDSDGNFDPAIYSDKTRMMIAKLRKAEGKGDERVSTVKAIVIGAVPTLDALLETDAGRDWVNRIIDKELNHVLVRPLRDAENVQAAVAEMPTTLEAFISSGGAGGSTTLEAFNESYRDVIDLLAKQNTPFRKARLTKPELRRAIESKAYALKWYEAVEDRGEGKESLFVIALKLMIAFATEKGFDSTLLTRWLETRDATTIEDGDDDSDDFDIDALTATLTKPADETAPVAVESTEPTAAEQVGTADEPATA